MPNKILIDYIATLQNYVLSVLLTDLLTDLQTNLCYCWYRILWAI